MDGVGRNMEEYHVLNTAVVFLFCVVVGIDIVIQILARIGP